MATKDDLLKYLKEHQDEWLSGEALSNRMAVSRSAVWKQVSRLRQEGYVIKAAPNRGYQLSESPELLLPAEIREGLRTEVLGRHDIVSQNEVDSTNRKAHDLAALGAPEGTLVVAEKQTGGRGRRGRAWFSPAHGGIYASIVLRPKLPPHEAPKITLLTGVAVADALMAVTPLKPAIKWPNDILVNDRKICGILTETSMEMDAIHYVVVGVGINVNIMAFPEEIEGIATSVQLETGRIFERVNLLREFLSRFEKNYGHFLSSGFGSLEKRWRELAIVLGKEVTVHMIDTTCQGRAVELDGDGALIIEEKNGERRRIYSGDIQIHGK